MSKNSIIITLVSVVALFGLLTVVYMATSTPTVAKFYPETTTISATDHVKWSKDKKHILVEYGDLQCPACGTLYRYMKDNVESDPAITKNITFVFRHFPLSIHVHSTEAAYAAEAAGKQGKFFEMADKLFLSQDSWGAKPSATADFTQMAKELKLNMDQYEKDVNSDAVKKTISDDLDSGGTVEVNSTPTFFLDGKKLELTNLQDFKTVLTDTAKQQKMVK